MKKSTFYRLISYVSKYKGYLFVSLIFAFISNVLIAFMPLIVGKAIDKIVAKGEVDFKGLINTIIVLGAIYIISALCTWLFTMVSNIVAYNTVKDLRNEALSKINILPLEYFDKNPHGDIISRLTNDMDNISDGLVQGMTQFYPGIITIISSLILMVSLSFKLTAIIVVMTPLCFLIASFIAKRSNKMFREQQKTLGELNGYIEEIIGNQKIVRLFGYEGKSQEAFSEINGRLYKCGQLAQFYSSLTNPSTRFVNNVTYILVGFIGGILSILNGLSIGVISSFLTYSTQFSQPINNITSVATMVQAALASCERVFAILDEEPEKEDSKDGENINRCQGNVKFENVSFSYDKKLPLIQNFSVDIRKGSTVAIVGPTGAGKTTMVNLLMRFYDADKGKITIDGKEVNNVTRENLRNQFGMVLQDTWLFQGTIKENIAYGKPNATTEEIEKAAKSAYIHSFIKRLPNGYDTVITEGGGNLSEGQKQLLTIARVMLIDPPMIILDEATSNVDTRTELKIQNAFLSMMKERTSFVIAHRLSTIRDADLILVMKNGKIVERGNHDKLVNKGGIYTELYNSQFKYQL